MTTSRADQVAARRVELLQAAHQVVLARGLANTRVADVAQATNVSGGLIHYHFATKEILLTEMMRGAAQADIDRARKIARGKGSALDRLDKLLRHWIPAAGEDENWTLWIDAWGAGLREPAVAAISDELDSAWVGVLAEIVADGQESGEFRGSPAGEIAIRLGGLLDGLGIRYTLGRGMTRRQLLEHARTAAALELGIDKAAFAGGSALPQEG